VATAAAGAAAAHIPLTGHHLDEAPYMGALFIMRDHCLYHPRDAAIIYDAPTVYLAAATACGQALPSPTRSRTLS
jgi:hypothetical protein